MSKRPRIVAHRGYSAKYPENTLAAFQAAVDLGVDAVELDVRRTKDGEIVVLHDAMLDRTTDGSGPLAAYTWEELQMFSAGEWFDATFRAERIPRLADVFPILRDRAELLIEIKETGIEDAVVRLIWAHGALGSVSCGSFDRGSILAVRKLDPAIPVCLIAVSCESKDVPALVKAGIRGVNLEYHHLSPELLEVLHDAKLAVNAWTVDAAADLGRLAAMGVDAITTNDPAELRSLLFPGEPG
jgi:glycerophosphoryl diester phosphodiesterase